MLALLALIGIAIVNDARAAAPEATAEQLAIGQRIYREGVLPSGRVLQGVGQAGVTLKGKDAACTTCHRRSGYGSSEGPIEVRAITGPALFGERVAPAAPGSQGLSGAPAAESADKGAASPSSAPQSAAETARAKAQALRAARAAQFAGGRQRPPYDDASLARAIRAGTDVSGRAMNAAMPRYALDDAALSALTAYLRTLSVAASPGVTETQVHFATVIQPGTSTEQRRALVEMLEVYFKDRNRGQRAELRRENAGQVHLGRTYREWVLHVWELQGASDTWGAQLEHYNQQQAVFALVSGLGSASWQPIHDFSERHELPCILPQADVPVVEGQGYYTVYLSQGITLEAQSLAKFLRDADEHGPVVQVYRREDAANTAAAAFRKAWAAGQRQLSDHVLEAQPDAAYWRELAREAPGATLVLWLRPEDLANAQPLTDKASPLKAVYLSSALVGEQPNGMTADDAGRLRLIYPQDLPAAREARLDLVKRWMSNNGIKPADERLQLNTYIAATVVGMMVTHSKDTYSRDFLLERMEHRLGTSLETSIYPRLSLGPGQRFASKGSYIVKVNAGAERTLSLLSDWIVP